jgi:hypothetical protein
LKFIKKTSLFSIENRGVVA